MDLCSPTTTPLPLPPGLVLPVEDCPSISNEVDKMKNTVFCEALGSLMWLQVTTVRITSVLEVTRELKYTSCYIVLYMCGTSSC